MNFKDMEKLLGEKIIAITNVDELECFFCANNVDLCEITLRSLPKSGNFIQSQQYICKHCGVEIENNTGEK